MINNNKKNESMLVVTDDPTDKLKVGTYDFCNCGWNPISGQLKWNLLFNAEFRGN